MALKINNLPATESGPGKIVALVVAEEFATKGAVAEALKETTPNCQVLVAETLDQFRNILQNETIDFVAFEISKMRPEGVLPLYETKLFAQSIGTIVLAEDLQPAEFDAIMRSGCDRILLKREGWLQELRAAIRQIIRLRRLENENSRLLGLLGAKNSELLEKNSRLDEYSATVAHDIRGLVSNVVMRIEFALESANMTLPPELQAQFQKAADTGRRVIEIVKSSYELARLGIENQKFERIDLMPLLNEINVDLGVDQDKTIALKVGNITSIVGSRGLIRRVFLNLISNSIRYRARGPLSIAIQEVASEDPRFVAISVKDNGLGISKDKISSIFRPYWRGDNSSTKSKGLGLGLAIVDRIIGLHGGSVSVKSDFGYGSEFVLTLPVHTDTV